MPQSKDPMIDHNNKTTWYHRGSDQHLLAYRSLTCEQLRALFILGISSPCGLRPGRLTEYILFYIRLEIWALEPLQIQYLERLTEEFYGSANALGEREPKMAPPVLNPAKLKPKKSDTDIEMP